MTDRSDADFSILTVCTGNVCRSPAAERLLAKALGPGSGISVTSAGVGALVGEPIHPPMATLLQEMTVDVDGFAARRVTEAMVRDADVVLPLTREHRGAVVEVWPGAVRRTFTLRELARRAQRVEPDELDAVAGPGASPARRLTALLPLAAARRAQVPPEDDDVIDPYRRGPEVYRASLDQILPAVEAIARAALGR